VEFLKQTSYSLLAVACTLISCAGHTYVSHRLDSRPAGWPASGSSITRNSYVKIDMSAPPELAWKKDFKIPLSIEPTVFDGIIFLPTATGELWMLGQVSGKTVAKRKLKNPVTNSIVMPDSMTKADSIALIHDGSKKIHAINWRSGKTIWEVEAGRFVIEPAIYADMALLFVPKIGIKCLRLLDGVRIWEFKTIDRFAGTAAVDSSAIYVTFENGRITCLSLEDGSIKWNFETNGRLRNSPVLCGNSVLICTTEGDIYNIERREGKLLWHNKIDAIIIGNLAADGERIYAGSLNRSVYAIDFETGESREILNTDGPIVSAPTIINNHIFITALDHTIYCADKNNGEIVFTYRTEGMLTVRAVIFDGKMLIAGEDGFLYCFKLK